MNKKSWGSPITNVEETEHDERINHVRDRLMKLYPANEKGMWQIKGEDPNPDMGGPHVQPDLGTVSGTFSKVIEYALGQPAFIAWGYGGDITKISSVVNVDALDHGRVRALKREYSQITSRMKEIEAELAKLTGL